PPMLAGALDRPRQLLAPHRAHAGTEEVEIRHDQHQRAAIDVAQTGDEGFHLAGLRLRARDLVRVWTLTILELERILRTQSGIPLDEAAGIGQQADALPGSQPEVMTAFRADPGAAIELLGVDQLAAFRTLHPEILRDHVIAAVILADAGSKFAL